MKSSLQFKLFILLILIIIPISILYFNLGNKLLENNDILEKNQNINRDYINICRNSKKAQFYIHDSITGKREFVSDSKSYKSNNNNCKYQCDICNCDFYAIIEPSNICNIYTDTSINTNYKIKVNCSNKNPKDPDEYDYIGAGEVSRQYYDISENKNNFTYYDYLFDEANAIKSIYENIDSSLQTISNDPSTLSNNDDIRATIGDYYSEVSSRLSELANYLDLSKNFVYSDFIKDNDYSREISDNMILGGSDLSYSDMLIEFKKKEKESRNIEARLNNDNLEYNRKYLIYTILTILMIISIIIFSSFIFYPDLLPDSFLIYFFIGILLLVFFIHTYLKV